MNSSEISNARPGEEPFPGESDPQDHLFQPFAHDQSGILGSEQFDQSRGEFPIDPESSADWALSFPVSESGQPDGRPGEKWLKWAQGTQIPRSECLWVHLHPVFFFL